VTIFWKRSERLAEKSRYGQVRESCLKRRNACGEGFVRRAPICVKQMDALIDRLACKSLQIGHERCDANSASDQDDWPIGCEWQSETAGGCLDLDDVVNSEVTVDYFGKSAVEKFRAAKVLEQT
jgi:hypothetical protein